jgi:hypothetical protein
MRLQAPDARLEEEFSYITSLCELSDGRTLVTDSRDNRLVVIDWRTRQVQGIGRLGDGPGEYRQVGRVYSLAGDSSLLTDTGTRRWFLLHGARIVKTIDAENPLIRRIGGLLSGADADGNILGIVGSVYSAEAQQRYVGVASRADSILVIRVHPSNAREDTVARLRGGYRGTKVAMPRAGTPRVPWRLINPLGVPEQAILFSDGWVALAKTDPFRVSWVTPSGRWIEGPTLPFEQVIVDDREKHAVIRQEFQGRPDPGFVPGDYPNWPETLPPFDQNALVATTDQRLLLARLRKASDSDNEYYLINRQGRLDAVLMLKSNERIVATGVRSVYVTRRDDDDILRLQRHPWP